MFILSLLVFLPKLILGFSLAHLTWRDTYISSMFLKVFLGIPLGMGVSSILLFFWKLAGFTLRTGYIALELGVVTILFILVLFKRKDYIEELKFDIKVSVLLNNKILLAGLIASIGISLASFLLIVLLHPHGREDAFSNWNLIARFIYYSSDLSNTFAYLASSTFPGYPFMIGLDVANGWIFLNTVTTRVPILVAGLFTFSISGIIFFALARLKDFRIASMATILISTPWLAQFGATLYADIPMAVYYLATGVLISLFLNTGSSGLVILAGFTSGFAAWTKNDGIPFVMIVAITMFIISARKKDANAVIGFFKGLALPMVASGIYKIFFAAPGNIVTNSSELLSRIQDYSRFKIVFDFFVSHTVSFGSPPFGLIWILLAVTLIGGINTKDRNLSYIIFILISQFVIYFSIYLITPLDLKWHLVSSGTRVLTHLIPLLFFVVFSSLRHSNITLSPAELNSHATHN